VTYLFTWNAACDSGRNYFPFEGLELAWSIPASGNSGLVFLDLGLFHLCFHPYA
jgi:hypothetical protein